MSVLADIAAFVADADVSSLSEADQRLADRHFSDTLVALAAGSLIPEGRSLLPLADSASFAERIGLISATARLTEIDDIHIGSCVTPGAVTVPVALGLVGMGRDRPASTDVLSAAWAGVEVMTWLGTAIEGPRILSRGVWPTFAVAPLGAAAVSSRMLGLSTEQTTHALSLALMLMAGGIGHFKGERSGRWMIFASSVAAGIRAAMAAQEGYTGDVSLLDGDWLSRSHGIDMRKIPFRQDGCAYRRLSMKPYCSAKQSISAIEAFGMLLDKVGSAEEIVGVVAEVPSIFSEMVSRPSIAGSRSTTLVSLRHQIALRAYARAALYDIDRSNTDIDPSVLDFASRVEIRGNTALLDDLPHSWGARVTVALRHGGEETLSVSQVLGDPDHSLDEELLLDKWRRVFLQVGAREHGEAVIAAVRGVRNIGAYRDSLLQLCAPQINL